MRRAVVTPSPRANAKWRATLYENGHVVATVDFGAHGSEDYTTHHDPHRMAFYLRRHGGLTADEYAHAKLRTPRQVHRDMLRITDSTRENWTDPTTPGFWARWLLWSEPSLKAAAERARQRGQRLAAVRIES